MKSSFQLNASKRGNEPRKFWKALDGFKGGGRNVPADLEKHALNPGTPGFNLVNLIG
jgi:hypothetical protein